MKNNKLIITVTFFICLSFVFMSNHFLKDIKYQNFAANDYYTETTLELRNNEYLKKYIYNFSNDEKTNISITSINKTDNKNKIRKIALFNDSVKPEIKKGRFISSGDFYELQHNYAVVCETLEKDIKDTIEINNVKYEIIGIYKKSGFTSDNIIFTNLKKNELDYSEIIKIDYNNNQELYQNARNNQNLNIVNDEYILFFDSLPSKTVIALVTILFCLSILIIMYFYTEEKKEEIKLKFIFGYSLSKIYFDGLLEILPCLFVSWTILFILFLDLYSFIYLIFAFLLIGVALFIPVFEILNDIKLVKKYEEY